MRKYVNILTLLISIIVIISMVNGCGCKKKASVELSDEEIAEMDTSVADNNCDGDVFCVKLRFAGDVMLAGSVATRVNNVGGGNYKYPFAKVGNFMRSADITFANLESPITDLGSGTGFRAVPEAMNGLLHAGIDIVSVANEHFFDYGTPALADSLARLTNAGIQYAGAGSNINEAFSAKMITRKGIKIAFLAYTAVGGLSTRAAADSPGLAYLNYTTFTCGIIEKLDKLSMDYLRNNISDALNAGADIVIVSLHAGDDLAVMPNSVQEKYAQLAIDSGAHLVIGHHSHSAQPIVVYPHPTVIQPVKSQVNNYIAFSLGSFVHDKDKQSGYVLDVTLRYGKIAEIERKKDVEINSNYQPVLERH